MRVQCATKELGCNYATRVSWPGTRTAGHNTTSSSENVLSPARWFCIYAFVLPMRSVDACNAVTLCRSREGQASKQKHGAAREGHAPEGVVGSHGAIPRSPPRHGKVPARAHGRHWNTHRDIQRRAYFRSHVHASGSCSESAVSWFEGLLMRTAFSSFFCQKASYCLQGPFGETPRSVMYYPWGPNPCFALRRRRSSGPPRLEHGHGCWALP